MNNLRETIKDTVRYHLKKKKHLAMGQCLTAVGWVGGTLPELYEKDGMIEISMADVAGAGFVVGAALAGRRPMYIIRYQGFNWYNAPMIVNYACKSKEIWKKPCPIFIRSIAMEGNIGPVAGSSHTSLYYRMPGIQIYSPMTPKEYINVYKKFLKQDDVFYVSEHRGAYNNEKEIKDIVSKNPELIVVALSITRFNAFDAIKELIKQSYEISFFNLVNIKPLKINRFFYKNLGQMKSRKLLILDDDYEDGIIKSIAVDLTKNNPSQIHTLGLKRDKSAGFHPKVDNLPPSKGEIVKEIKNIIDK